MTDKKIKVLVLPSDRTGVGSFRSINPHIALEEFYPEDFSVDIQYEVNFKDLEFFKKYNIVHFHRTLGPYETSPQLIKTLDSLGIVTIIDLDDYWSPGQHHPAYHLIKQSKLDEKILENLKASRYATTTTKVFANEMRKYNKNVFVLPNAINPKEKQYIPNPEKSDKIRIGWCGGSSHQHDVALLEGVVSRLETDGLLDKVQFVLCGFDLRGAVTMIDEKGNQTQRPIKPQETVWYKYEKVFTNNYQSVSKEYKDFLLKFTTDEYTNVKNEPYRRVWTKPVTSYANHYNLFDISLAPLEENIFNASKSQLKVIEAGFHKKALIAQNFGPYQIDLVNAYEKGGNINKDANSLMVDSSKNHKDWYKYIKKLVQEPELISVLGNNLYETVNGTYDIESVTKLRSDLYKKLAKKYEVV